MNTSLTGRKTSVRLAVFSADTLKIFATIVLFLQSVGIAVFQKGLMHLERFASTEEIEAAMNADSTLMSQATAASVLELAGGLAVPIFAFLLVEGFKHTSNQAKYLLAIGTTAVISEVPFDMAYYGVFWNMELQNGLLSMTVALLLLHCLKWIGQRVHGIAAIFFQLIATIIAVVWVVLLGCEYGVAIVPLAAVFYLLDSRPGWKVILGILITVPYITSPMAFYGIWCYNEQRKNTVPKYFYYVFYPLHLLVLSLIAKFVL